MIPRACKRLAEVDFPIDVVSKHATREKSIRHGHPSTLHLWWARRPLASSRAVLLALLLPDPCDEKCPEAFKRQAREILRTVRQPPRDDVELRTALLWFVGAFANWDMAANQTYLEVGRHLVRAAHGEAPLVVDPFAGGGSIPLEALRLGCEAFASDLNPVACLILKVMLEEIPRHGPGLGDELRKVGGKIKAAAERELANLYPPDPDRATPVAYLWARTVRCEAPNCGAEIPLLRSLWLCKKNRRKQALRPMVLDGKGDTPRVAFEIFEPDAEKEVRAGTVARAKAACVCCGAVLPPERVRRQLAAQRGGADVIFDKQGRRRGGAFLLAVVILKPGKKGRCYRLPTERDYEAVRKAQDDVAEILAVWEQGGRKGLCPVPDEPTPAGGGSGAGRAFSVQRYGMLQWGDLFTARQKVTLVDLVKRWSRIGKKATAHTGSAALSRLADKNASLAVWNQIGEKIEHVFGRQALPIVWDFAEVPIFSNSTGNFLSGLELVAKVVEAWPGRTTGQVQPANATDHPLPNESAGVWFTDPPYYDAIPYADLSDFFLVWLKRTLPAHPLLRDARSIPTTRCRRRRPRRCRTKPSRSTGGPRTGPGLSTRWPRRSPRGRRVLREESSFSGSRREIRVLG